ncbi:MAG: hypothetical protein COV30_02485 [Candidatus Yanofskybacteria bacterium CG10_big_fil_rev_8_21_14_0_10_37_15]|uniref:GtrA/DPMS transmembrane domain-containing protein n=1 Tax=Candidatus Yanofskybacteria bacterium CG10_big_fil_rev_8_21_14_0_10_37_15 TaxID=1975097 RepID=A0A2H0R5S2_9BACT|nr:MAG: hypothetical protein COV30_02485 [Candidatus Yanofskybacteria bacterium CG10_big_fil_rev_8_21_14_0_10_37_15]
MNFFLKFSRKDLFFSFVTGLITGFSAWRIFEYLEIPKFGNFSFFWLILIVPVLWFLGVNLGYFLGRWLSFFNQFGKFSAVGFTNAAVYFGILNFLIYWFGINKGLWYSVFIALSFVIGATHSYFWNKFWVFDATDSDVSGQEFSKFLGVSMIAGLLNVGIASGVVNLINPIFELTLDQWANIGGVAGSAVALAASFIGFKLVVFKK